MSSGEPNSEPSDGPADVIAFWVDAGRERWFKADEGFDAIVRDRFGRLHERAAAGELEHWEGSAAGALALVLALDQIARNIFRGSARAWTTDPAAFAIAERAIARGHDLAVAPVLRRFFYLPFMHAEDEAAQERSVALNEPLGDPEALRWARDHHNIISRFGRFPHRNSALGRASTPEEE